MVRRSAAGAVGSDLGDAAARHRLNERVGLVNRGEWRFDPYPHTLHADRVDHGQRVIGVHGDEFDALVCGPNAAVDVNPTRRRPAACAIDPLYGVQLGQVEQ